MKGHQFKNPKQRRHLERKVRHKEKQTLSQLVDKLNTKKSKKAKKYKPKQKKQKQMMPEFNVTVHISRANIKSIKELLTEIESRKL